MSNNEQESSPGLTRRAEIGEQRRAKTRAGIMAAVFDLLGQKQGVQLRIEDIASHAGITRAIFYNHFSNLTDLLQATSYELSHDFFVGAGEVLGQMTDPAFRIASAVRYCLHHARKNRHWATSIVNLSANGIILGVETYRQAGQDVMEGMEAGKFKLRNSLVGRDIALGTCLAAISTMLTENTSDDYPELIAKHVLIGLGVPAEEAAEMVRIKLPSIARFYAS